jgi:hypothetical protein
LFLGKLPAVPDVWYDIVPKKLLQLFQKARKLPAALFISDGIVPSIADSPHAQFLVPAAEE